MTTFADKDLIANLTARMLIEVEAVLFRPAEPFRFTSGRASPVYVDCRKLISFPRVRDTLMDFAVSIALRDIGFERLDAIAGGETAGIPFAAWIADRLSLPMLYVRKKPKGFGRNARIEGIAGEGARVLLVEDLATDGGSKVAFVEGLRAAGLTVEDALVVFFYDSYPGTREMLAGHGIRLHALTTWRDVIAVARAEKLIDEKTLQAVESFLHDPVSWSRAHGGTEPEGDGQVA